MVTKEIARVRATKLAQALHLGRTMLALQEGCSIEEASGIAFEEHMALHRNCPCCHGSVVQAEEITKKIFNAMEPSEK